MPHKFNTSRRHKFAKKKYRVTNWCGYNESLRNRGDLTVWITGDARKHWAAPRRRSRGGQPRYSDLAITMCLTLGMVYRLLRLLPGSLRAEVRQGRGLPGQGPRRPADVLRLPRRALEACTHDQPHREHVRHGSSAHLPDQGLPVAQDGDGHGLQTMPVRSEKMEKTRWIEPSRRDHSRRQIRRWRTPGSRRRMISPYTTFDGAVKSRFHTGVGWVIMRACLLYATDGPENCLIAGPISGTNVGA